MWPMPRRRPELAIFFLLITVLCDGERQLEVAFVLRRKFACKRLLRLGGAACSQASHCCVLTLTLSHRWHDRAAKSQLNWPRAACDT
jgi:hypothetical protein